MRIEAVTSIQWSGFNVNTFQPFNKFRAAPSTFNDFLRSRRSIRTFTNQPIADEVLREILETATYAPSAHGMQPWRFVIVEGPGARKALGAALTGRMQSDMAAENASETEIRQRVERSLSRIQSAPKIILLCQDEKAVRIPSLQEAQMGMQSLAMAGLQLMLSAHAHGIGSVWVCWPLYAPDETQNALDLPDSWRPQGIILLGYPAKSPPGKNLNSIEEVTRFLED
jgi:coenzyme F420-0:L-glutamate ligase / coenzyme F420-1:gamma-L-glutamate ligase